MRLKALDRLLLCDGCGELYTYSAETSVTCPKTGREFCSLACYDAYDKHGNIVVFRCWGCAKELSDPAPVWELRASGYMATFCSPECQDFRFASRPLDQSWNCGQCNKPFVGAAYIYRLPDGTGEYCSAACRDIAQGERIWRIAGDAGGQGWISTNERLPKNKDLVLLRLAELYYDSRIHLGYRWLTGNGGHAMYQIQNLSAVGEREVTHWQPLPAPPVIQKGESGRCEDCAHWRLSEGLSTPSWRVGVCSAPNDGVLLARTHQGTGALNNVKERVTVNDWGCVQFAKAKDG